MDKEPFIGSLQSLCSQLCTSLERLQIRTQQCNTKGNGAGSIQSVNQPMRKISSPCCKASNVIADIQGPLDDLLFNVHTNEKRRTKEDKRPDKKRLTWTRVSREALDPRHW